MMDFASHRGITFILIGRSVIQLFCLFDVLSVVTLSFDDKKSPLHTEMFQFQWLNPFEALASSSLVVQL